MAGEFEVVAHTRIPQMTAFLVRLEQRVTHIHRELELGCVLEGSLLLRTENHVVPIETGELYLVNRMEPHEFSAESPGALLIAIQFSAGLTEGFLPSDIHDRYAGSANLHKDLEANPEQFSRLCALCVALAYHFLGEAKHYEFRCFTLCGMLLQLLREALCWERLDAENYAVLNQRANRIMEITNYIDRNFQRKLLLSEIAQQQNLSMVYLSHFFKDTLGMSFQQYLNRKRFEYACTLLFTTRRKILDISLSSGYSDVRYFNEAFFARYGCSPKEYRRGKVLQATHLQALQQNSQSFFTTQDALEYLTPLYQQVRGTLAGWSLAELL